MRQSTFVIALLISACSTKTDIKETSTANDSTSVESVSNAVEPKAEASAASVTLDSLLKFNSEAELKNVFGANVKRSTGSLPEDSGEYPNTLLFPDTKNEVEFVWDDTTDFKGLSRIHLSGTETEWKTKEGLTLGTKLKELEKLNKKPFAFYGFEWDYAGMVEWDNDAYLKSRKINVSLALDPSFPEYGELTGDQEIKSDSKLAQKANPYVSDITMRK